MGDRYTVILKSDNITIDGDVDIIVNGKKREEVAGDFDMFMDNKKEEIEGDLRVKAGGNEKREIGGSYDVEVDGRTDIKSTLGTTIHVIGLVSVKGSIINLN